MICIWTEWPLSHQNCSILSPINCFKSPKLLISNALWRAILMTEIEVTVLHVISKSSKYKKIIIKLPSYFCIYTFRSDLHLWKFCERRKASILEYHSLGVYFNLYSDFFTNQRWIWNVSLGMLHVYLLMNISMYKGIINIHMMHFPVLGFHNCQN